MPIVFVHGVGVRDTDRNFEQVWTERQGYLRRYIAPLIAPNPELVSITRAYWGDLASYLHWNGSSCPAGQFLGMGGAPSQATAAAPTVASLIEVFAGFPEPPPPPVTNPFLPMGAGPVVGVEHEELKLSDLSPDELSNLVANVIHAIPSVADHVAIITSLADDMAHEPDSSTILDQSASSDEQVTQFVSRLASKVSEAPTGHLHLLPQGPLTWREELARLLRNTLRRAASVPGLAVTGTLAELRRPLNREVMAFFGDVVGYLSDRGTAAEPGKIPRRVLEQLAEARDSSPEGEALIIVTHSMGGQIVYDLVTHFIPQMAAYHSLRVDFWCATASQVGLFEELKLFLSSDECYSQESGTSVPYPDHQYLGFWSNVWDYNDFLSYSVRGIVDGQVDDWAYNSMLPVSEAHGGYLRQPNFYRLLAAKIRVAMDHNWHRP